MNHDIMFEGVVSRVSRRIRNRQTACTWSQPVHRYASRRSDGSGEGGGREVQLAEHGTSGPGMDARRVRGLVSEKVLDHTGLRPAFLQMGCDSVTLVSCTR